LPLFRLRQYHERMSFGETIFLFVLALIVFGPKKLPEIARQVGRYLAEFRRASNEFKAQIEQEIAHLEVQERQKALPPSAAPQGATGRSLKPAESEPAVNAAPASPVTIDSVAAESATVSRSTPDSSTVDSSTPDSAIPAAEAAPAAEPVATPATQESHV
jgi:sec-independent protein translocase protein TatB